MLTVHVRSILGIAVPLFFQCISVLLNPTNSFRGSVKWAFVIHTVALFSFLTIPVGIDLNRLFITYINDREFPGNNVYPPGPIRYDLTPDIKSTNTVYTVMFPLNQWLADGLLVGSVSNLVAWGFDIVHSSCITAT